MGIRKTRGMSVAQYEAKLTLFDILETLDLPAAVKAIPLTRGMYALVDADDYERLMQWNWYAMQGDGKFYASRTEYLSPSGTKRRSKIIRMHNEIMRPPKGMEVDHRTGDSLDNRRDNLRICLHAKNAKNLPKPRGGKTSSPYKGVSWHKHHECWQAMIKVDYKQKWLGNFADPRDAALAYNKAALEIFGEYARLNDLEAA